MPRNLSSGMLTQIAAPSITPIVFVSIELSGGSVLYFWNGVGTIDWNSQTWQGLGNMVNIAPSAETSDLTAQSFTISLNGCNPSIVSAVLANIEQGKQAKIWLGMLDSSGAVIADPYNIFTGFTDVPTIVSARDNASVSLTVESELARLLRASPRRYTATDIKIDHPTDRGFDYVASVQLWDFSWGGSLPVPRPISIQVYKKATLGWS